MVQSDILILGAGCAGLTAAIYSARAGYSTTVLEKSIPGGQAAITTRIDNYPGLPNTDGITLTQAIQHQAESLGAQIHSCAIGQIDLSQKTVHTELGTFTGKAIILATGAEPRELGIPGEQELRGKGISYCASCDGFFYRDQEVVVVGGGNSACEEALYLAGFVRSVTMLVRRDVLRCEAAIADQISKNPKIHIEHNRALEEIRGKDRPERLVIRNTQTGEIEERPFRGGVFIFAGYRPATASFAGQIALDEMGYVVADAQLQTSVSGVFAAGDLRQKELRQIVTAVSDGAIAAHFAGKALQSGEKMV